MSIEVYDYLYELTTIPTDITNSSESLFNTPTPNMANVSNNGNTAERDLIIKYSNGVYRIWMDTHTRFTTRYTNKFCRFLDTRSVNDTVVIYLGAHLESDIVLDVPSILSAIISAKCNIHAVASGPSSAFETAIYCFAKTREIRKYGYLTFTRPAYVKKFYKEWEHINSAIFERAVQLGLLTPEQVDDILKYNNTIIINYNDIVKDTTNN
jgi:hypothetical protein